MPDKFKVINDKQDVKTNYIVVILDKSGSMDQHKNITISGFNEQAQTIQKMLPQIQW